MACLVVHSGGRRTGAIVFLKLLDGTWQRAFLDAGLAFWEDWGESGAVPSEIEDDDNWQDWSPDYRGGRVLVARATTAPGWTTRLEIEIEGRGRILLHYLDETDWESDTTILRTAPPESTSRSAPSS